MTTLILKDSHKRLAAWLWAELKYESLGGLRRADTPTFWSIARLTGEETGTGEPHPYDVVRMVKFIRRHRAMLPGELSVLAHLKGWLP